MVSIGFRDPLDPERLAALILAAEEIRPGVTVHAQPMAGGEWVTRVKVLRNVRLPAEPVSVGGSGVLEELVVVSPSSGFGIRLVSGNTLVLDADYATLEQLSPFVDWVSAYQDPDTGVFVASLSGIEFSEGLRAVIYPVSGTATLDRVVAKLRIPRGGER